MMKSPLTLPDIQTETRSFSEQESGRWDSGLYGVTDGKAVGTYLEHRFRAYLRSRYEFEEGSSAKGIDFPSLGVDMKVTSIRQPQSSCPFKSARQKIYGLGYGLLVFVYEKSDDRETQTGRLDIHHVIFIEKDFTADYQTTTGILKILDNDGNIDDLTAFMYERRLPLDEIQAERLAEEVLQNRPNIGYLTISNALQWRLQYRRAIEFAGDAVGINRLR